MRSDLMPEAAWEPFEPGRDGAWDLSAAAHLFRRAGFGADRDQLEAAVSVSPTEAVDQLLSAAEPGDFQTEMSVLASSAIAAGNVQPLSAWWLYRMLATPCQLLEKLTLFWHGHFATGADKVTDPALMLAQNQLLRRLACGRFEELVQEVSRDPAMLLYLDAASSRKAHPNENYARELMELFCLGEGRYTEQDIREIARCFTGWEVRRGEYRFNRYQHDSGEKQFLGKAGVFGGEDAVRIVLEQPSAPEFLTEKLLRFFVMDEPTDPTVLCAPLARQFRDSGLELRPLLRTMLTSRLFFAPESRGRRVRSPVELAIGLLRSLNGSTNTVALATTLQQLGQGLFYPPSVKGWDGGRTWINSSTLLGRSNLVRALLSVPGARFGRTSLREYLAARNLRTPEQILEELQLLLFAVPPPPAALESIAALLRPGTDAALTAGLHALCTLPEFQLG
ncbi:MAG: hypothetical protein RLZZ436_4042 [Planctomycetota bacterium]|jgi:uncharacterized protein (DUF1800 family)